MLLYYGEVFVLNVVIISVVGPFQRPSKDKISPSLSETFIIRLFSLGSIAHMTTSCQCYKTFFLYLTLRPNKLECLSLGSLFNQV